MEASVDAGAVVSQGQSTQLVLLPVLPGGLEPSHVVPGWVGGWEKGATFFCHRL